METKKRERSIANAWLIAAAALIILLSSAPPPAQAAGTDPCAAYSKTADTDKDGFSDYDECNGISLAARNSGSIPGSKSSATTGRANRLDPNSRDLFVILNGSIYFPQLANPLEYLANPTVGLGIGLHVIRLDQTDPNNLRRVCGNCQASFTTQKAVMVTEDTSPGTGADTLILGSSPSQHGNPNGTDLATVYTVRIKNHLQSVCGCPDINSCSNCCDNAAQRSCGQALFYKHIKHSIAHEIGHQIMLAPRYDAKWGWHYAAGTGVDMDYQVSVSGTIFNVGTTFTDGDRSGFQVK